MTVICKELFASRSETIDPDQPTAERLYHIIGTEDAEVAKDKARSTTGIAKFHGDLPLKSWDIERLTPDAWAISAQYEKDDTATSAPFDPSSFDVSTATTHIERYIALIDRVGPRAGDPKGVIDYDGVVVRGADVLTAITTFSITKTVFDASVGSAYLRRVTNAAGKVNSRPFAGFQAGELLMQAPSGQRKSATEYEITYQFGVAYNVGATIVEAIPSDIVVPARKGWHYQWTKFADVKWRPPGIYLGDDGFEVIRTPVAVYIAQIYEEVDFDTLGVVFY